MTNNTNINETADIRKLATVATILDVFPIEGADAIEGVKVRGWNVVVKKGEYKVGDKTIYVEVDSVLPDGLSEELALEIKSLNKQLSKAKTDEEKNSIKEKIADITSKNTRPEFEFLRNSKFRIKTRRIFGQISQGICFPLSILNNANPEYLNFQEDTKSDIYLDIKEGDDVTDALDIVQFIEPEPANLGGDVKGALGNLGILVSDEERIENLSDKYNALKEFKYVVSEKLEGSSVSFVLKNDEFNVCSRKLNLKESEKNTFWKVARQLDIENKMRAYGEKHGLINWSLQGELVGEGVQGNIYKLKGHNVGFYNAFNIDMQEYIDFEEFMKMIEELGLETCPIIDNDYTLPETTDELFEMVDNFKTTYGNSVGKILAEGWVFVAKGDVSKAKIERSTHNRLSFKAKSRNYDIDKKR